MTSDHGLSDAESDGGFILTTTQQHEHATPDTGKRSTVLPSPFAAQQSSYRTYIHPEIQWRAQAVLDAQMNSARSHQPESVQQSPQVDQPGDTTGLQEHTSKDGETVGPRDVAAADTAAGEDDIRSDNVISDNAAAGDTIDHAAGLSNAAEPGKATGSNAANVTAKSSVPYSSLTVTDIIAIYEAWDRDPIPCGKPVWYKGRNLGVCGGEHPEPLHKKKEAIRDKRETEALVAAWIENDGKFTEQEYREFMKQRFPFAPASEMSSAETTAILIRKEAKRVKEAEETARGHPNKPGSTPGKKRSASQAQLPSKKAKIVKQVCETCGKRHLGRCRLLSPLSPALARSGRSVVRPVPTLGAPVEHLLGQKMAAHDMSDDVLRARTMKCVIDAKDASDAENKTLRAENETLRATVTQQAERLAELQAREDASNKLLSDSAKETAESSLSKEKNDPAWWRAGYSPSKEDRFGSGWDAESDAAKEESYGSWWND